MSIFDKLKTKLKPKTDEIEPVECYPIYPGEDIIPATGKDIPDIVQTSQIVAESFGNFLNRTNTELQTNLAVIDAGLKRELSKMESSTAIAMRKEENLHERKMADRELIQEVIEMTKDSGSEEIAMRILDSIDNLVNQENK